MQAQNESTPPSKAGRLSRPLIIVPLEVTAPLEVNQFVSTLNARMSELFLNSLKNNVHYLGPLRFAPASIYEDPERLDTLDIGSRGQHTAALLHTHGSQKIRSLPKSIFIEEDQEKLILDGDGRGLDEEDSELLKNAVQRELVALGLVQGISTEGTRHGITLQVATSDSPNEFRDLSGVGVGVSQVLPVIVRCLLTKPGETLILEQPELHLHPATVQKLADFFIRCALTGRNLIIETHSEHLVNKMRLEVAEDDSGVLQNLVGLMFAEQSNGVSTFRESKVSSMGNLDEDWPDGFLDISGRAAAELLEKGLKKRLRQRENLHEL